MTTRAALKTVALSSVSLLALAAVAQAADMPLKARAPVVAPYSWNGLYVGGSVGYAHTNAAWSDLGHPTLGAWASLGTNDFAANGAALGLNIGYNWQVGRALLGAEADISYLTGKSTGNWPGVPSNGSNPATVTVNQNWLGTLRLRGGFLLADNLLIYATGGLAYGNPSAQWRQTSGAAWDVAGWRTGWTAGGGLEYALNRNWTVRGEALYVDFGSKNATDYGGIAGYVMKAKTTETVGRLGVNYKF